MAACVVSPMNHLGHDYFNGIWGNMSDTHNLRVRTSSRAYEPRISESKKSTTKKRASRAGTRSVSTLSAAQLERKRANDREAQRAIRQRTKNHIDTLERNMEELRDAQRSTEKALYDSKERGRVLEHEIKYLQAKLSEAGLNVNWSMSEVPSRHGENGLMLQTSSSMHHQIIGPDLRAGSISTQFGHSGASSRSPSSKHDPFPTSSYLSNARSSSVSLASSVTIPPSLTSWRSRDGATSGSSLPGDDKKPEGVDYTSDPFSIEELRSQPFGSPSHQQQPSQHYSQSAVQDYLGSTVPSHQQSLPDSRSYPSMMTSDFVPAGTFSIGQPQTFVPSTPYSVTPVQVGSSMSEYVSPSGQLQATSLPGSSYPPPANHEQDSYSTAHPAQRSTIPFRESNEHAFGPPSFANN